VLWLGCERRAREEGELSAPRPRPQKERQSSAGALVETRQFKFDDQSALNLDLEYHGGYLDFEPDTTGLLADLRFEFENEENRPEIIYDSTSSRPSLKIRSYDRHRENFSMSELRDTRWRIKISPEVVLDFRLQAGAIDGRLNFSGLRVENLRLEMGAGELDFAFDKPNPERPRISINAGAAATTASGLCNANFTTFEFHGGAGKSDLFFDGVYEGEGRVDLKYGVGLNTVLLAKDLGARIRKSGSFLAPMSVHGFDREGDIYYSKNYEQARGRLDFDIEMGVGHTTVKWLD
jgi:hypothetical protein